MECANKDFQYKGFALEWEETQQSYNIFLEGQLITQALTAEIGKQCIDFFHEATSVSFDLHRKRAENARSESLENAGPEPEVSNNGRPNVAWVRWYRAITGCGIREAHAEALSRIGLA